MAKRMFLLFIITILTINCTPNEKQNLDISVNGKVTNQNNVGIPGVSIYVQRGLPGYYVATSYENYETLTTDSSGNYSYTVKYDNYSYRICCGTPTGYTIVGNWIIEVDQSIINSHTVPNIINFRFTR
jgi:hypothetical protein